MLTHLVLFRPRQGLSSDDREQLAGALERALQSIPTIRRVRIGRRVRHGASYESTAPDLADVAVLIEFEDLAGLQTYLRHPAHVELGARFNDALESALICDYEMSGAEGIGELVRGSA